MSKVCNKCNHENVDDAKFCCHCGEQYPEDEQYSEWKLPPDALWPEQAKWEAIRDGLSRDEVRQFLGEPQDIFPGSLSPGALQVYTYNYRGSSGGRSRGHVLFDKTTGLVDFWNGPVLRDTPEVEKERAELKASTLQFQCDWCYGSVIRVSLDRANASNMRRVLCLTCMKYGHWRQVCD